MIKFPEFIVKIEKTDGDVTFEVKDSRSAYNVFLTLFDANQILWKEEVVMICLDTCNKLKGYYKVSSGGLDATLIDSRVVFTVALLSAARSIIIAHNHPSGNTYPSKSDIDLTGNLVKAGELLGIKITDHLIISPNGYYSMADEGVL